MCIGPLIRINITFSQCSGLECRATWSLYLDPRVLIKYATTYVYEVGDTTGGIEGSIFSIADNSDDLCGISNWEYIENLTFNSYAM